MPSTALAIRQDVHEALAERKRWWHMGHAARGGLHVQSRRWAVRVHLGRVCREEGMASVLLSLVWPWFFAYHVETNRHLFGAYFWDCDAVLGGHCYRSIQCFEEGRRRGAENGRWQGVGRGAAAGDQFGSLYWLDSGGNGMTSLCPACRGGRASPQAVWDGRGPTAASASPFLFLPWDGTLGAWGRS